MLRCLQTQDRNFPLQPGTQGFHAVESHQHKEAHKLHTSSYVQQHAHKQTQAHVHKRSNFTMFLNTFLENVASTTYDEKNISEVLRFPIT